ncbi:MAG TPA: hypothetical protein VN862_08195 [Candidatus Acidoferrales bacterium]|nr:hypothetical protein [Candidatus Acidoferrales bacterium]
MSPTFDIFEKEPDGGVRWCGTAATFEHAKDRIRELSASAPGEYIIFSVPSGDKFTIKSDGLLSEPAIS